MGQTNNSFPVCATLCYPQYEWDRCTTRLPFVLLVLRVLRVKRLLQVFVASPKGFQELAAEWAGWWSECPSKETGFT